MDGRRETRSTADGGLRADRWSLRAYAGERDAGISPVEFELLWRLLEAPGEPVSREALIDAVRARLGRELEPGTVSRRMLSLRVALKAWKDGELESVRGGFYRLAPEKRPAAPRSSRKRRRR